MAISRHVDLLEPIDLAEHLDKVELYLGQVCQIAGISKMQLDYWTNKAQIPTKGKKQRIYDIDALETVMLIKQAKDKGLNLGAAIDAARRFREDDTAPRRRQLAPAAVAQRLGSVLGRERVDEDSRRRARAPAKHGRAAARSSRCQWPDSWSQRVHRPRRPRPAGRTSAPGRAPREEQRRRSRRASTARPAR